MVFLGALLLSVLAPSTVAATFSGNSSNPTATCQTIQKTLSSQSGIFYPGTNSSNYDVGLSHWANSSSQAAACVVEPASAGEVAKIVSVFFALSY
jgi:hypothetical protein